MIKKLTVNIKDYPLTFNASEACRPKYYKETDKIPKKYKLQFKPFNCIEKGKKVVVNYLVDDDGVKIIKNLRQAGKPKVRSIRGQNLFSTQLDAFSINKILELIKKSFRDNYVKPNFHLKFPVKLEFIYNSPRRPFGKDLADLDNMRIFYEKAIIDSLKVFEQKRDKEFKMIQIDNPNGILPEDNVDYINEITSKWVQSEERLLVVNIYEQ